MKKIVNNTSEWRDSMMHYALNCKKEHPRNYSDLIIRKHIEIAISTDAILDQLPDKTQADVLRLQLTDGFSYEKISKVLHISVSQVRKIKRQAIEQFINFDEKKNPSSTKHQNHDQQ